MAKFDYEAYRKQTEAELEPYQFIVGQTVDFATDLIKDMPRTILRATLIDGQPQMGTEEVNPYRINVHVNNGVITALTGLN